MQRSRSGIQSEQSRKPGFRCQYSNIFLSVLFQILVTKIAVVLLLSTECPTSNMDPKTFWIRSCVTGNFESETLYWLWEAAWLSGWSAGLAIQQSRVRVSPWPLAGFVLGCPEFKSSATLVNSQLVCLRPVGILNPVKFNLNYLFLTVALPTSISAINTAEGK